ncbi:MAG TPA: acyl-CoA desaturase [Bacteroidetes bacterium]|nr:acyl-CoA desaturase [Bacteroidota bacterium]
MAILIFFIAHHFLSLFSQSFFYHRYAAHGMFTMSRGWEKFFLIFSYVVQGSSYLSAFAYGILHRRHHAYADTEKDVHSPKYDKTLMRMMWRTKVIYSEIFWNRDKIESKMKKDLPEWLALEMWAERWPSRIMWGLLYITFYIVFATQWWMYLLLPIHFAMGPIHGAIINWYAHKYGYTNFKLKDTSKNLFPINIIMLGEGLHNNHHKYGGRPNFAVKWWEFDPIYPIIWTLDKLKVITLRRSPAS